jgi:hypothetical protein
VLGVFAFFAVPQLMILLLLWAVLPRRWFPIAAALVFAAHWVLIGYTAWELDQLDKLPFCETVPPGTKCNKEAVEVGIGVPLIGISSIIWLALFFCLLGLRYLWESDWR